MLLAVEGWRSDPSPPLPPPISEMEDGSEEGGARFEGLGPPLTPPPRRFRSVVEGGRVLPAVPPPTPSRPSLRSRSVAVANAGRRTPPSSAWREEADNGKM